MKVLLGITGSVAGTLVKKLVIELNNAGHEVQVVTTFSANYFQKRPFWNVFRQLFKGKLGIGKPCTIAGVRVWSDFDEWRGRKYQRNQEIAHIALRDWADVLVIAPCSANTLAKMANGICDNLLTCIVRAWDRKKSIVIAPAMNTKMWEHPVTEIHLTQLQQWYNLQIAQPVSKKLACGDDGIGALASITQIVKLVK